MRDDKDAEKTVQLFEDKEIAGVIIGTKEGPLTPGGGRCSDAFCGTLSISSGLHRRKIPFVFAGICFPEEQGFLEAVANFVRTCAITKGFRGAKIGLVGPRPDRFETCAFNEAAMIKQFSQRVIHASLADIFHNAEGLSDDNPSVQKILREIKTQVDTSVISEESLKKIAKLEHVLKQFAEEKKLAGMGIQCWTAIQEVYGVSPCLAMGRLTDQGIVASCEVNIYGTLPMLVQYLAALKTTPPHFIDWTIQHQEQENVFLAWHCGNAPPSLTDEGCQIIVRHQSVLGDMLGPERSQGTGEFQLKPGLVTICRLVEYDGKFKMLITKGRIKKSAQKLRGSWSWVEVPDLTSLYKTLIREGFTHHASMIHGDYAQAIIDSCKFLGIETVVL